MESPKPKKIEAYVHQRMEEAGITEQEALQELLSDGWLTFVVEESGGATKIDASQLFKKEEKVEPLEDFRRLREKFAPISTCIEYLRDQILGGGVETLIKDPKKSNQKEIQEECERLIDNIYQDEYARTLHLILPVLVDKALTYGASASEIVYEESPEFWDYASVSEEQKTIKVNDKEVKVAIYDVKEPTWKELKGVQRFKIIDNAIKRMNLQRDGDSWEAKYWIIDEGKSKDLKNVTLAEAKQKAVGQYFHTWQIFWLLLNRKDYKEKGRSVIEPVLGTAKLLEKIMKAVGEGIHRAGNKKYFIVCGTEKRPWSGPHIRNVLQQLREASKKNWSTIPMPRGFSIEEMGGEVFEAKDVVNYFRAIIARGMRVPARVLGVDTKDEKEYSYSLMRLHLAIALKHQLLKRHIWCKFGKTQGKQGGKSERSTYIPDIRFKIEDLLSIREKVDLYIDTMNQANPAHPLVKLKTEIEYCRIMGWGDVIECLPSLKEFAKELEEGKKQVEKQMKQKAQGPPSPQTEERQKERLKGMQKKSQENAGRGKAREMGGTRIPNEVQESLVETPNLGTRKKDRRSNNK